MSRPTREIACSSRFFGSPVISLRCSSIFGGSLLRRNHAPHLIKGIHVERQRVKLALVVGYRRVRKAVELGKLGDIIPDLFVVGMEDMCAVLMDVNALNVLGINIARNIGGVYQQLIQICHVPLLHVQILLRKGRSLLLNNHISYSTSHI